MKDVSPETLERLDAFRIGMLKFEDPDDSMLMAAWALVTGERRTDYAHPLVNFVDLAIRHTLMYMRRGKLVRGKFITPQDIIGNMLHMKESRQDHRPKPDNIIDNIGYLECYDLIDDAMRQLGFPQGILWFDEVTFPDMVWLFTELTGKR